MIKSTSLKRNIPYDVVTCISRQHLDIGVRSIRSLIKFSDANKIIVITANENINFLKKNFLSEQYLIFLNEEEIIPNVKLIDVASMLAELGGNSERAGWYYQQFLKMNISRHPLISKYYLIFDSDTIMLRKMNFFNKSNKSIINTSNEFHKPYFETIRNFGLIKTNNFSFISEHMLINSIIMQDLITLIEKKDPKNLSWIKTVISYINKDSLSGSGFSEFETYGTYLSKYHRDSFITQKLKSCRLTLSIYGKPNQLRTYLILLFSDYYWATFENWDEKNQRSMTAQIILKLIRISNNLMAKILVIFINITNSHKDYFETAKYLSMPIIK